jgi:hypothetical protein
VEKVAKIIIGFIGVAMLIAWLRIIITPMGMAERLAWGVDSAWGLSSIRSFVGGFVLCIAVFCFLTLKSGNRQWVLVPLCLLASSTFSRSISLVMNGFHSESAVFAVVELVLTLITFAAYRKLPTP